MPPVAVSEFLDLLIEPSDSLGTAIVKVFVRLPVLIYRVYAWAILEDGSASAEAREWICAGCAQLQVNQMMEPAA